MKRPKHHPHPRRISQFRKQFVFRSIQGISGVLYMVNIYIYVGIYVLDSGSMGMFQKKSPEKFPENPKPSWRFFYPSIQQKILLRVPDLSGSKSPAEGQIKKIIACLKSIASPRCQEEMEAWKPWRKNVEKNTGRYYEYIQRLIPPWRF